MQDTRERLESILRQRIAVLDGSWGVLIQKRVRGEDEYRGERFRDHPRDVAGDPDLLNLTQPDIVRDIHRSYFEAGADIATTNTFTATRIGQADYALEDVAAEMSLEGAKLAREVADEFGGLRGRLGRAAQRRRSRSRRGWTIPPTAPRRSTRWRRRTPSRSRALREGGVGSAPDRDRLRHAEREGRDRRRAGRRAGASALALLHGRGQERPQPLGADGRGVLDLGRARASRSWSASTARSARAEMRPFVEDLAEIAPTWVACYPERRAAERARRARRAAGGHEPLPRRVRAGRARQHRRRLLRDDAGARPADRGRRRGRGAARGSRAARRHPLQRPRAARAHGRTRTSR